MPYVPSAADVTQPTTDKEVLSAAEEFRTLKSRARRALRLPEDGEAVEFPDAITRTGKFLYFGPGGVPTTSAGSGGADTTLRADLASAGGGDLVEFDPQHNYVAHSLGWAQKKMGINIGTFVGADPTGATDMTSIMAAALVLSSNLILPPGTWAMNWIPNVRFLLTGFDSATTTIKAFDTSKAAITYRATSSSGAWKSLIHNVTIAGTAKVGVGVTIARTVPSDYTAGDEQFNSLNFEQVVFSALDKGVQFPYGNIESTFNNCVWSGNKYGIYSLDAKFGGTMHAGCKYIKDGLMSNNECAIYIHNVTDGFGGVIADNTIFEDNQIAIYCNTNNTRDPVTLIHCWNESNGATHGANTTIDVWTGTVKTTTSVATKSFIFDGSLSTYVFENMFFTDVQLNATDSRVIGYNCFAVAEAGFGGAISVVAASDSSITLYDSDIDGAPPTGARIYLAGRTTTRRPSAAADASRRWWNAPHRLNLLKPLGVASTAQKFTSVQTLGGSFTPAGTITADGIVYPACNQFVIPFTLTSQFCSFPGTTLVSTASWYVISLDVKWTAGVAPQFYFGDLASNQLLAAASPAEQNTWQTITCLALAANGITMALNCGNIASSTTFRISAFQAVPFATKQEAQDFLASNAFAAVDSSESIIAAATITIPFGTDVVTVTGATGINTITAAGHAGRRVTLIFASTPTVTDGSNLALNGNFVATADDTLTLACNGTNWYEVSRSVN